MLVGLLGGRAAEEIVFDTVTTGAANDIEKATKIARAMITQYGMSKKFGLMGLATVEDQYLNGRAVLNCGDDTATEIDHEVMALLSHSYDQARSMLESHREALDKIAAYLIRKETITGKEFMKIFRAVQEGLEIPENIDELPDPKDRKENKPEEHFDFVQSGKDEAQTSEEKLRDTDRPSEEEPAFAGQLPEENHSDTDRPSEEEPAFTGQSPEENSLDTDQPSEEKPAFTDQSGEEPA